MKNIINEEVLNWYSKCDNQGLSSKYLATVSIGSEPVEHNFPHDNSDFERCVLFKEYCPTAFKKAKEILSKNRPFKNWGCNVAKVWQEYFKIWEDMEVLLNEQRKGLNNGEKLFYLMQEIQKGA